MRRDVVTVLADVLCGIITWNGECVRVCCVCECECVRACASAHVNKLVFPLRKSRKVYDVKILTVFPLEIFPFAGHFEVNVCPR